MSRILLSCILWASVILSVPAAEKICPKINLTIHAPAGSVCAGSKVSISASDNEIAGNYNGMTTYPTKQWAWEVSGIETDPQTGSEPVATFTPSSGGDGTILFNLTCTSSPGCEDCDAAFTAQADFHVVEANLGVDCNHDGTYDESDEALEESDGGLLGMNHDDDNANAVLDMEDPGVVEGENDLIPIYLNPDQAMESGSVTLEAVSGGDKIRIWKTASREGLVTLPMTWHPGQGTVPAIRYVEGIRPSDSLGDVKLRLSYKSEGGEHSDSIVLTVLKIELVPDWNHDRKIILADENQATTSNPFRFWINDDNDYGDISDSDSDLPGEDVEGNFKPDFYTDDVDGRSDLLDFFPVWLDLKQTLDLFLPSGTVQYKLSQADSAVNAVYTDLTRDQAGNFLTTEGKTYGPSFNEASHQADTFEITSSGVVLDEDFLDKIINDENKGVLMIEGAGATTSPLVLEVWKGGAKICEKILPLSIDGVENMYRHVNLVDNLDVAENRVVTVLDRTGNPTNLPDNLSSEKNFVFVHGYNTDQQGARGWHAEIFKRLYKSGSRAKFTGVTWHGDTGANYHKAVINAMVTSKNLASQLSFLAGDITIGAHSLGNMVVSEAIANNGFRPERYFMFNAAVPIEAYDASQLTGQNSVNMEGNMCNPNWANYTNRLWASKWFKLFPGDNRNKLTWRDRFASIVTNTDVYNFYSEGEDVVRNADGQVPSLIGDVFLDNGAYAWAMQEMIKGLDGPIGLFAYNLAMPDQHAGWQFNPVHDTSTILPGTQPPAPASAALLTDAQLRTNAFFEPFIEAEQGQASRFADYHGEELFAPLGDADANTQAAQDETQYKLLAEAIPALSFAAAANEVNTFGPGKNVQMEEECTSWPQSRSNSDWLHSDLKNIAFTYIYEMYDRVVREGGLNE